jgi:hypothetical protein
MKISQIREEYYAATGTVSELVRKLSFAGIAIIWIFKAGKDQTAGITYEPVMKFPMLLLIAALGCDLIQYLYKSVIWGSLNTYHWRKKDESEDESKDVPISGRWNWPSITLFWMKGGLCITAYVFLFSIIYNKI